MSKVRLTSDSNGDVICPVRGLIDVEWCFGCGNRAQARYDGAGAVIDCDPGLTTAFHGSTWAPLHDLPDDLGS